MKLSNVVKGLIATTAIAAASAHATINVAGYNFNDNAFADTLLMSSGSYTTSGGSLSTVLTDKNVGTYAFSFSSNASVILGFTDNFVVNGAGADLAIFELGVPDTVKVAIGFTQKSYLTFNTGYSAAGFAVNVALVDLSDFGIANGGQLNYSAIGLDTVAGGGTVPSLSLVGALNSVDACSPCPEPETYAMMLGGLSVLGFIARRRKKSA